MPTRLGPVSALWSQTTSLWKPHPPPRIALGLTRLSSPSVWVLGASVIRRLAQMPAVQRILGGGLSWDGLALG